MADAAEHDEELVDYDEEEEADNTAEKSPGGKEVKK